MSKENEYENPKRLFPIVSASLLNPEGAVQEVVRARKDGCVGLGGSPAYRAKCDEVAAKGYEGFLLQ
jgi:hypothetical protein